MAIASMALTRLAQAQGVKADFLWIVDNSPSMANEQAVLASAADDIATRLARASCPIDWRMAVAYTDLHLPPSAEDVCPGAPGPGRRRVCPFTQDIDVLRNGTRECAYAKAGTCGAGSERGFNSARVAIDRFLEGTGCEPVPGSDCALRPDARLVIIFFTDTGEQTTSSEAPPAQPDNSVASWVRYFSDYDLRTRGAQPAQVHGILCPLRPGDDGARPCSDGLPDPGLYDRYSQVIGRMGGAEGNLSDDGSHVADAIGRIVDTAIAGACCGNGILEPGEQCDDGNRADRDCCSSSCRLEGRTTTCHPASGPCDVPEHCDGSSPVCPADRAAPDGSACNDGDACTLVDTCEQGRCTGHGQRNCDDGNACTVDSCTPSTGCIHGHAGDSTDLTCLCPGGLELPACTNQRPPTAVGRRFARACHLIDRARSVGRPRSRRLMAKAVRDLKHAARVTARATRRRTLSQACATALSRTITDLRVGVQRSARGRGGELP